MGRVARLDWLRQQYSDFDLTKGQVYHLEVQYTSYRQRCYHMRRVPLERNIWLEQREGGGPDMRARAKKYALASQRIGRNLDPAAFTQHQLCRFGVNKCNT
jgi:hypothetical protein